MNTQPRELHRRIELSPLRSTADEYNATLAQLTAIIAENRALRIEVTMLELERRTAQQQRDAAIRERDELKRDYQSALDVANRNGRIVDEMSRHLKPNLDERNVDCAARVAAERDSFREKAEALDWLDNMTDGVGFCELSTAGLHIEIYADSPSARIKFSQALLAAINAAKSKP